jgi:hypothetical protein
VLPEAGEAAQLAVEVARRLAEAVEPARPPVGVVHLHERVDELLADRAPAGRVVERGGHGGRDHVALDQLHDVERRADHALVVARREHRRRARGGRLERLQQARLAQHVVRRRRQRPARRAPQHPRLTAAADQVRHVGVALAERLGLHGAAAQPEPVQVRLERPPHQQRRQLRGRRLLGRVDDRAHGGGTLAARARAGARLA